VTVDAERFKQALSHWITGVTIVIARDGIHGMTVSAFTEVSLEPPLYPSGSYGTFAKR
jgi:flavin reductase (DIM6/NTAB) family NADH-FMN oxidoreductase RutF